MVVTVLFPDGPREIAGHILARNRLGDTPAVMVVPRPVAGVRMTRTEKGWVANGRR